MDLAVIVYILIAAMAASGGVLGAFWVRALTIMRRRMVDSIEELERLSNTISDLRGQIDGLSRDNLEMRGRLESAERLLQSGEIQGSAESGDPA